ncbi:MAG: hypothetical protein ACR2QF_05730 [Geminicoccaceae bacterium]
MTRRASLIDMAIWGDLLEINWDDPIKGENTALWHNGGNVPEQWLDKPSAYFLYRVVPGLGATLKVLNDDPEDQAFKAALRST